MQPFSFGKIMFAALTLVVLKKSVAVYNLTFLSGIFLASSLTFDISRFQKDGGADQKTNHSGEETLRGKHSALRRICSRKPPWFYIRVFSKILQGVSKWNVFFWKCYCSKTVKHIGLNWCFLNSQHYKFWYLNLTFAKKKREIRKFLIWKQWKIYIIKIFWNFLKSNFRLKLLFGLI